MDGLREFLEPNAFIDIDEHAIFPSAPISETSWDQAPELFLGLDAGMGLKPPGLSTSMFSLVSLLNGQLVALLPIKHLAIYNILTINLPGREREMTFGVPCR
jgi:hypothetical protein